MASNSRDLTLGEAVNRFLADSASPGVMTEQQELYRFVRWFGSERYPVDITGVEIANYAEGLPVSDADYQEKLETIRNFLVYARKKGWCKTNLSTHLKSKKVRSRQQAVSPRSQTEVIHLTPQRFRELEGELENLKAKRFEVIDEVQRAAADKDFRENAPLDAAREKRGKIEGQIMELEATLKAAVVLNGQYQNQSDVINIGDSVVLVDLDSGKELHYTFVSSKEVDPVKGKISDVSPIGRAVIGKGEGEMVEISVPAGRLRYRIKQIAK